MVQPAARARETAEIVAARIGLQPRVDARFAETDTGDWTERTFAEVLAEDPEGFARFRARTRHCGFPAASPSLSSPSGCSPRSPTAGAPAELPALVVCHRDVIRLVLAALIGDETAGGREIPNAALVRL